ncbi:MAG: zinc ribbon domain-containing protein [Dehalococcoidia bacterium]
MNAARRFCPDCGRPVSPEARFCGGCGHTFPVGDVARCPTCQQPISPGARFCRSCGTTIGSVAASPAPAEAAPPGVPPPPPPAGPVIPASARVQVTPAVTPALRRMLISAGIGLVASPLVLGIGLLLSYLAWTPLGAIPKAASAVVQPGTCTTLTPGTIQMYVCSAWVAVKTSAGSLMMLAALLGIGLPFALVMRRVLAPVPVPIRAAVSALTVTGGATMLWSGMLTGDLTSYRGFVWPQQLPALLGAYTFLLACFSPLLQSLFAPVLRLRDKIPRVIPGVVAAVPLLATLLLFPAEQRRDERNLRQ